ncbi:CHAP domain-containing protein [Candidatus Saccharibacteria bacterium]|nr:CHAP domain-containing protein [Candidatus Saccharibacteria bacterium]MBP5656802.1 CHAP domain-containing protein [Candidatus Saccharibacteria bacterium]
MKIWRNISYLAVAAAILLTSITSIPASATLKEDLNKVNAKISELNDQIDSYEKEAKELAAQADSISNQIAVLQNQQAKLKKQIELKQAEHDQIVLEIEAVQKRINDNYEIIGYVIAQYYYNDGVSTIERIASAQNFSSFVDEESRLSNVSDTLGQIVEENKALKESLVQKKKRAEQILADLDSQKEQLAASEQEQQALLSETKDNEARYKNLKSKASKERRELEEQQQKILQEIARKYGATGVTAGDPSKGGYPYSGQCPAASLNGTQYGDQWGMYICECVSYAAWKVFQHYGYMPYWGGRGNASQWPANARAAGYTVTSVPRAKTVGISQSGPYGHAVWVEAVSGNRVYISQYNYANEATNWLPGDYSEQWMDAAAFVYIYFR